MATADELPEGILHDIFCRLDSRQKRCVIPLVSKGWARIATQPGALWQHVTVDLRQQPGAVVRSLAQKWFAKRAECLHSLTLLTSETEVDVCSDVTAVLGGPESRIARLSADLSGAAVPDSFLASLSWLRQLHFLRLMGIQGPITVNQLQPLAKLQHLKVLEVAFVGRRQQLGAFPDVVTALTNLETLHFTGAGEYAFRKLPSRLSNLQSLKVLSFVNCGAHALRSNMTSMTRLQDLIITDNSPARLLKLPRKMTSMAALTSVDVSSRDVPVALGTLPNLRRLTLRALRVIQGNELGFEEDFARLLENLSLQELLLLSSQLNDLPHAITLHCSLEKLAVRNSLLTSLPPGPYLDRQGCLREVDLTGCSFSCVPEEALCAPWLEQLIMIEGRPLDLKSWREEEGRGQAARDIKVVMDLEMQLLDLRKEASSGVVLEPHQAVGLVGSP